MEEEYPVVGFHFKVVFSFANQGETHDMEFKEVQGLSATVLYDEIPEGGQNQFVHRLPKGTKYADLTLSRGFYTSTEILTWCRNAIEKQQYKMASIDISLLDENALTLATWHVENALPVEWSLSKFDAMESNLVMETLKLTYDYFKKTK